MKKFSLLITAVTITLVASAQVEFGIKAGLNLSTFTYSGPGGIDPAYKTSFNAGVLASIPLFPGFSLQPEAMYSGQGFEQSVLGQSRILETGYINIPVLFKYQHETGLFVETGPQIGFILNATNEIAGISADVKDDFQSTDFSWAFGLGYKFSEIGLGIDARYNMGLSNIARNSPDATFKNSVFQVGVFYMFEFSK